MDPEKIKAALEAIKNGDADAALALLEEMIAAAAGAEGDAAPEAEGAELADPPAPEEDEETEAATVQAAAKALSQARSENKKLSAAIAELQKQVKALTDERAAADATERVKLVAELVKLGAETPATAWAKDKQGVQPVARLANEPLAELKDRVAALSKGRPAQRDPRPPVGDEPDQLSPKEIALCKQRGIDPADFAARKAAAVRSKN